MSGTAAHLLEGSQTRSLQASRPGSNSGVEDWKGDKKKPQGATPGQPSSGIEWPEPRPATPLGRSMPSAWATLPHCWASTERLGSAPRHPPSQQRPQPLPRGTACMPRLFQNLQGTCTPPETLCPGSGHSLACLCQAWPRFSLQPRPHASAQGSRNLDRGWDRGPAVGAAPLPWSFSHTGITTAASYVWGTSK